MNKMLENCINVFLLFLYIYLFFPCSIITNMNSGNMYIPWKSQGMYIFPEWIRHYTHSLSDSCFHTRPAPVKMEDFVSAFLLLDAPKRERQHWVHPINEKREKHGEYHHLFEDLRKDEFRFNGYVRMKPATFDKLHCLVKERIAKR